MRVLYHHPFIPACRTVRLALKERSLECTLTLEKFWEQRPAFLEISPTGEVPVLVDDDGTTLTDPRVICEFLEEMYPQDGLTHLGKTPQERAETRRLFAWFEGQFNRDVTEKIVFEKGIKQFIHGGGPTLSVIRQGHANLIHHLEYLSWLIENRPWLGGDRLTFADMAAAAHLSCIDYFGDIPWHKFEEVKDWYARIKSRPAFRPLLSDRHAGIPPSAHYDNLDF